MKCWNKKYLCHSHPKKKSATPVPEPEEKTNEPVEPKLRRVKLEFLTRKKKRALAINNY